MGFDPVLEEKRDKAESRYFEIYLGVFSDLVVAEAVINIKPTFIFWIGILDPCVYVTFTDPANYLLDLSLG